MFLKFRICYLLREKYKDVPNQELLLHLYDSLHHKPRQAYSTEITSVPLSNFSPSLEPPSPSQAAESH